MISHSPLKPHKYTHTYGTCAHTVYEVDTTIICILQMKEIYFPSVIYLHEILFFMTPDIWPSIVTMISIANNIQIESREANHRSMLMRLFKIFRVKLYLNCLLTGNLNKQKVKCCLLCPVL